MRFVPEGSILRGFYNELLEHPVCIWWLMIPSPGEPVITVFEYWPIDGNLLNDLSGAARGQSPAAEWMPAQKAVEKAQAAGLQVNLSWLSRSAASAGVLTRTRIMPGKHKMEVEFNSLVHYLTHRETEVRNLSDSEARARIQAASASKKNKRPLA
jgi:hypothetical protein